MKALVLEDDMRLNELLRRGLRDAGWSVDAAGRVDEAMWLIRDNTYDVLVLDVMLPDGDGFALCATLRAEGRWTPTLLLTARDAVEDRVRGLDVGADDYLVKPFAVAELLARMRALARRGATPRPVRISVGDLEIDPSAHAARAGGETLALTAREHALLELFTRHPDEVLSRARIIEQVWDWAFDGDPRIVDVYVRALRQRLGTGAERPVLDTVRRVGYVLRSPAPARVRGGRG